MDRPCARRNVVQIARNNPNYYTVLGRTHDQALLASDLNESRRSAWRGSYEVPARIRSLYRTGSILGRVGSMRPNLSNEGEACECQDTERANSLAQRA